MYTYKGMNTISRAAAILLYNCNVPVYRLYDEDDTEALVEERKELYLHDGQFGVEASEWGKALLALAN